MAHPRIQLVQGDITSLDVDAIVTAANESLCGGGGVDGAIHRTAGPGLFQECRSIGICPEGEARITGGHLLQARHIIHTVGPVWDGGGYNESETLKSCYSESIRLLSRIMSGRSHSPALPPESTCFPKIMLATLP